MLTGQVLGADPFAERVAGQVPGVAVVEAPHHVIDLGLHVLLES